MKKILGLDVGFGDLKITLMLEDGTILHQSKHPSKVGITKKNPHIQDSRIYDYKGHSYAVGENALHLPSENIVDIKEYQNLEYFAPLFLYHAIKHIGEQPDVIVTGLSIAQIESSGYFKETLQNFEVNGEKFTFNDIFILPQGAGCVQTIKKFGDNFPQKLETFLDAANFVLVDIGFNTIDLALVTNGKTSPSLFEGVEKEGVSRIAYKVAEKVKEQHGRMISLAEAKEVIDSGYFKLRGNKHDFGTFLEEVKADYIKNLLQLVEQKYGKVIDKCDFIFLCGGGSALFKTTQNGFIRVPKTAPEFYNSIGFGLFGISKL